MFPLQSIHCRPVWVSFQMKEAVDKQITDVLMASHAIEQVLALGDCGADDDLAALRTALVGKYVGDVVLVPELLVEILRTRLAHKHERDIPPRKNGISHLLVWILGIGGAGEIANVEHV